MSRDMLGNTTVQDVHGPITDLLQKLGGREGDEWLVALKRFLRKENPWPVNSIVDYSATLFVNYDQSVEDAVEAGNYDPNENLTENLTSLNFLPHRRGVETVEAYLVHFGRSSASSDEVLEELDKQGFRPATIEELLALGAQYPDLQRRFPIVALGSMCRGSFDERVVPALWSLGRYRNAFLSFDRRWTSHYRFAAVRKQ